MDLLPAADALALVKSLRYFVLVFNGSDSLAMAGRDKDATWRWLDDACCAPGWSEGAIEDGIEYRFLPFRGYVQGVGGVSSDKLEPDWTIAKMYPHDRKLSVFWTDGMLGTIIIQNVAVVLPTDSEVSAPAADAPAASPVPNDGAGLGYQAARVVRALDRLEMTEGFKLSDHTDAEMRRLALEQIPERDGEALPSRQTLDRVIRSRRGK